MTAEDVLDLETHRQKIADPDDYRVLIPACFNCGHDCIHALCFRERMLRPADHAAAYVILDRKACREIDFPTRTTTAFAAR